MCEVHASILPIQRFIASVNNQISKFVDVQLKSLQVSGSLIDS